MVIRVLIIALMPILLFGCLDAATTGASAVYNQHSLKKVFKDQNMTREAYSALQIDEDRFKDANIAIATFNGDVLLAGQAPYAWQPKQAEAIVKKVTQAKRVFNLVKVTSPSSSLQRISDTWVTAKVKARLMASDDIDSTQIKVVTENGIVYLMGILTPAEADVAVDLTRTTDGVARVVKIFSYVEIIQR